MTDTLSIADQIAASMNDPVPVDPEPVAADTYDWPSVPPTLVGVDVDKCDPEAAELLPPEDPGVGLGFITGQGPGLLVVAYGAKPTQKELAVSSRRSGWEVRPVVITDPGQWDVAREWGDGHTPEVFTLDEMVQPLLDEGGSDLHITVGQPPWYRIGGTFTPIPGFRRINESDMVAMLTEAFTEFDVETFDGDLDSAFRAGGERWRANIYFERGHLSAAWRVIPTDIPSVKQIGTPSRLLQVTELRQGLVVIAGPTGSGKSTTLATLIDNINRLRELHVLTIEAPIEFVHGNKRSKIDQREVHVDTSSMLRGIKSAMREDPDVMLVGEIRDYEEISAAITAAETGHLVFCTIHASSAEGVIDRMIDVFPAAQQPQIRTQLAGSLKAVFCQALVPDRNNPKKRHLAFELMMVDDAIRAFIAEGESRRIGSEVISAPQHISFEQRYADLVFDQKVRDEIASAAVGSRETYRSRLAYLEREAEEAADAAGEGPVDAPPPDMLDAVQVPPPPPGLTSAPDAAGAVPLPPPPEVK